MNLYAGIGGNRALWGNEHEIVAIENNPEIAAAYQENFPNDTVVVGDAHKYLLDHYQEFDFIWSSPPCPTHSVLNRSFGSMRKRKYPDMKLYQEIIFLKHWFKGKWVVENVMPYYEPLIRPHVAGRHCFWSNFIVTHMDIKTPKNLSKMTKEELGEWLGMSLEKNIYVKPNHCDRQVLRNCVHPELGLHVFKCAFKEVQVTL